MTRDYEQRLADQEWEAMTQGVDVGTPEGIHHIRDQIRNHPEKCKRALNSPRFAAFINMHRDLILDELKPKPKPEEGKSKLITRYTRPHPSVRVLQQDLVNLIYAIKKFCKHTDSEDVRLQLKYYMHKVEEWVDRLNMMDSQDIYGFLVPVKEDNDETA